MFNIKQAGSGWLVVLIVSWVPAESWAQLRTPMPEASPSAAISDQPAVSGGDNPRPLQFTQRLEPMPWIPLFDSTRGARPYMSAGASGGDVPAPIAHSRELVGSFDRLLVLLKPGDTVRVTDTSGQSTTGRLADLSSSSLALVIDGRQSRYAEADVRTIAQVRHGSLSRGAKWGLGIGIAVAFLGDLSQGCFCYFPQEAAVLGGLGTAIGVGISASARRRDVIYEKSGAASMTPTVSPIVTRDRQGLLVSLKFQSITLSR